jgi:hypothetical protein
MKPIHWVVGIAQAALLPYVIVTAVKLAIPNGGWLGPTAGGVFGAGCALAGFVLVFEYAMGKAELCNPSTD